jgi:integrase
LWRNHNLGDKPKRTCKEAVVKYIKDKQHKKSIDSDITGFRTLAPYFEHFYIHDLTRLNIDEILDVVQDEREISNARVNRLASLKAQIGLHNKYVFSYAGKAFYFDYTTWHETIAKAGITNFRFYDLRHTWASWHVQAGTSLQELMELGAWSDIKMVLRYAHLSSEKLQSAAGNIIA